MRKYAFAFVAVVFIGINCYGQAIVTPRRHASNKVDNADPSTIPPRREQPAQLPAALPVSAIKIKAKIDGQVATVLVEHQFRNDTDDILEGTYYFPVPEGATLVEFAVYDGDQRRVGRVKEKEEARTAYSTAVAQGEDPAILEMTKRGWFQSHVYPIPPRSEKRVEVIYSQLLSEKDEMFTFDYPLGQGYKKLKVPVDRVEIDIDLRSEVAIKNVFSPTHPLDINYDGDRHATCKTITAGGGDAENFKLVYQLSNEEISASLITYREKGKDGYFLLMLSPKVEFDKKRISAKDVVFVIDVSYSMEGDKIRQAKEALRFGLKRTLNEGDRFNIIAFAGEIIPMERRMIQASPQTIARALDFVDKLQLQSATNINDALLAAMAMIEAGNRAQNIVFITDGQPTASISDPVTIAANVKAANNARARLFTFGVGADVNRLLLEKLAAENRGGALDIRDQSHLARTLSSFFSMVSEPVLSGLQLDFGPVSAHRVQPAELPDLYTRTQIRIFGRYSNQEDLENVTVALTGKMNEQFQRFDFSGLHFPLFTTDKDFLPKLWATERVSALLAEIRVSGERPELKQEVIDIAREFNLITPYTSMYVPTTAEIEREKEEARIGKVDATLKVQEKGANPSQVSTDGAKAKEDDQAFERLQLLAELKRDPKKTKAPSAGKGSGSGVGTGQGSGVGPSGAYSMGGGTFPQTGGGARPDPQSGPINGRTFQSQAQATPGAVVDQQGAAVAGATVTIKDERTGVERKVTTDSSGNYSVAGLPPGNYQVQVEAPGFNKTTIANVPIQQGQTTATGVALSSGSVSETVTLTATTQIIDTSASHLASAQESRLITDLPSLRPVHSFARLAPGVHVAPAPGSIRDVEVHLRFNGLPVQSTTLLLNGLDNNGIDGLPAISIINFDAVESLNFLTTRATGDLTQTAATATNIITRSGTNEFHGSLFDYHLTRRFGAFSPLERRSGLSDKPRLRSDIFGGTFGGPLKRDRAFFFASFARETENSLRFVDSTASHLTPTARGLEMLARAFPQSATINDLIARGPLARVIGGPQVGRTFIIQTHGLPVEFGQISRLIPSGVSGYEGGGRFDFEMTIRDRLQASYWYDSRLVENSIGRLASGYAADQFGRAQHASAKWTRLASARTTNELGFAFNRTRSSLDSNSPGDTQSLPGVSVGLRGLGYGDDPLLPASQLSSLFQISETLIHTDGRHNLRLGGQLRARATQNDFLPGQRGHYNYASFEDFILDHPVSLTTAIGDRSSRFKQWQGHAFIDDSWRARSNLTLSFGLSYENSNQPINQLLDRVRRRESDRRAALFDPLLPPELQALEKIGRDNNNFAPRIGIAYTPRFRLFGKNVFGEGKTIIRGGASVSYDDMPSRTLADAASSAPNILLGVVTETSGNVIPDFPRVPEANELRDLLGRDLRAYARTIIDREFRKPYSTAWHLDAARELDEKLTVGIGYVGTRGAGLIRALDGNPSSPLSAPVRVYESSGHSIYHSLQARADVRLTSGLIAGAAYTFSKLIDDVPTNNSQLIGGIINADSFTARLLPSFAQNPFDTQRGERALSSLDRRHKLTGHFSWELPLRRDQDGFVGRLLSGWKASGIIEAASGSPFTPLQYFAGPGSTQLFASAFSDRLGSIRPFAANPRAPFDAVAFSNAANTYLKLFLNSDGSPFVSPTGFIVADRAGFRAGQVTDARFVYNDFAVEQAARALGLAPDAFGQTFAAGRAYGDVGRNTLISPRLSNVDFAMLKTTKLNEKVSLQFRAEFFNLFNHPNRATPNFILENAGGFGFADVGEIDAAPRHVRIALKLIF